MLKVDLHVHTADDPHDRIPYTTEGLIDHAAELGFDAVAVTLHDAQLDVRRFARHAQRRGLVLIPGIERTIEGKHVLLLNFPEGSTEHVRSFEDLSRLRQAHAGLVVAPHPFFPLQSSLWGRLDDHEDLFDAVEVNAMFTEALDFNAPARRWAAAHRKPLVGNGDVHRLVQMGTTFSLVEAERTPEAICRAIAAGRVEVRATPHRWTTVARVVGGLVLSSVWPGSHPAGVHAAGKA